MKDILIVEDTASERQRLEKLFTAAGYSVVACTTVAEAEKTLQNESFRAAVLDIGLSDKSGSYLFNSIKSGGRVSYIVIFTGNPSVHLKQRFMEEGAADYIVKGSSQAQSEPFLNRIKEIIGGGRSSGPNGIPLVEFLNSYVDAKSRKLFLDMDNSFPACKQCKGRDYIVVFSKHPQIPPEIRGQVLCSACGSSLNPEVE
jgi:DNA-binding response OmpR family regulator